MHLASGQPEARNHMTNRNQTGKSKAPELDASAKKRGRKSGGGQGQKPSSSHSRPSGLPPKEECGGANWFAEILNLLPETPRTWYLFLTTGAAVVIALAAIFCLTYVAIALGSGLSVGYVIAKVLRR